MRTTTTNGMAALTTTGSACLDLFGSIGAMRGQDPTKAFLAAYNQDPEIALRVMQWARDIRGGAGERELFRKMMLRLLQVSPADLMRLIPKVPEIGRWDDLLVLLGYNYDIDRCVAKEVHTALKSGNALCAKWMPRKGKEAKLLATMFGLTARNWRKGLAAMSKTVEQAMCAKQWGSINFSHVPSQASVKYRKAFLRNDPERYTDYLSKLSKGDPTVKINAGAIYPHSVVKGIYNANSAAEVARMEAQWKALPNYIPENSSILPMVDVSGSMARGVPGSTDCVMDVAVALGMYCAEKNTGSFKDLVLTFSARPGFVNLSTCKGIVNRYNTLRRADWGMNTNIEAAFELILDVAVKSRLAKDKMPKTLLILSDMQFDEAIGKSTSSHHYYNMPAFSKRASELLREKYKRAGYNMPNVVFWNLADYGNKPVRSHETGVALVSGFSPAIMGSVLGSDADAFNPTAIMLKTVCVPRYHL